MYALVFLLWPEQAFQQAFRLFLVISRSVCFFIRICDFCQFLAFFFSFVPRLINPSGDKCLLPDTYGAGSDEINDQTCWQRKRNDRQEYRQHSHQSALHGIDLYIGIAPCDLALLVIAQNSHENYHHQIGECFDQRFRQGCARRERKIYSEPQHLGVAGESFEELSAFVHIAWVESALAKIDSLNSAVDSRPPPPPVGQV